MKKIFASILIVVFGITLTSSLNYQELTYNFVPGKKSLYHSKDGRFKIYFQGKPKVASDIVETEVGDIEMVSILYEKSVTEAYMVAYSDYPSALIEATSSKDLLDGAKEGSSTNLGLTKYDLDKDIKIDGYPGVYFKGKVNGIHVEYKIYLVENRLYQVAILRDGSYSSSKNSKSFFNSFELDKK